MGKLEDILEGKDDVRMDNYIWALSILALLLNNDFDKQQTIINIYLGDE